MASEEKRQKTVSQTEGIALFVFLVGVLSLIVPWSASRSGIDVSVYVTPMFLIIGVLNMISGIALLLTKK